MNIHHPPLFKEEQSGEASAPLIAVQSHASYLQLCSLSRVTSFQFPGKILSILEKHKIPIFFMVSSSTNLSMIVKLNEEELAQISPLFTPFAQLTFEQNISVIAVTDRSPLTALQLERRIVESLSSIPLFMISHDNSSHSLFLAIHDHDLEQALDRLHQLLR